MTPIWEEKKIGPVRDSCHFWKFVHRIITNGKDSEGERPFRDRFLRSFACDEVDGNIGSAVHGFSASSQLRNLIH